MSRKIDVASAPHLKGARYPMPYDEPCAPRERWRLGDAAGLSQFGVNLLRLPAGAWSSQRHWHSAEDEFVWVLEGVVVGQGAVLSMGVYLGASTKIIDRATGEVFRGKVPPYAVVVPGSLPDPKGGPSLYCAVIVKRVDAQTRSKTSINELLRD